MRVARYFLLTSWLLSGGLISKRYDEVVKDPKVTYVAGGASQNAARGAAVSCPKFDAWIKADMCCFCSMYSRPSRWFTLAVSGTMSLLSNSKSPTSARDLVKSTSSKRVKRPVLVPSLSPVMIGRVPSRVVIDFAIVLRMNG